MPLAKLLRKPEVSSLLGIAPRTLDHWVQHGKFPTPIRLNGEHLIRFRSEDVQEWLDRQPSRTASTNSQPA